MLLRSVVATSFFNRKGGKFSARPSHVREFTAVEMAFETRWLSKLHGWENLTGPARPVCYPLPALPPPSGPRLALKGVRGAKSGRQGVAASGRKKLHPKTGRQGVAGRRQGAQEGGEGRGSKFESRPAHKSPDFGLARKSAVSGEIVGEIRKSGFRDLVRNS